MTLGELAGRVEKLDGPDREVDVAIFRAIGAPAPFQFANKLIALEYNDIEQAYFARVSDDMRVRYKPPAYTASVDAAMTLIEGPPIPIINEAVERVWDTIGWSSNRHESEPFMRLFPSRIAAAALRARERPEG